MPLPFSDGNFANWRAHDSPEIEYPFPGDTASYIVRQKFRGFIANYTAPNIAGATYQNITGLSRYTDAYCTSDTVIVPIGGGVGEVERVFAKIPASRIEPEFYPFTFPEISGGVIGNVKTVTNVVFADSNTNVVLTSAAHGLTNANFITFAYLQTEIAGRTTIRTWGTQSGNVLASNTNTVTVRAGPLRPAANYTAVESFRDYFPAREARTILVPGYTQSDFFFPGVTPNVASTDSIPIIDATRFYIAASGNTATQINASTVPSIADWRSRVFDNSYFVAEPSQLRRWQGNIFERVTRWVKYT